MEKPSVIKQKVVENELDKLIHEQEERKLLTETTPKLSKIFSIDEVINIATIFNENSENIKIGKLEKKIEFLEAVIVFMIKNMT